MNSPLKYRSYPTTDVADFFLSKALGENISIEPLKLQKLVYMAHGWSLALRDLPLINESFQAWETGPMTASLGAKFSFSDFIDCEALDLPSLTDILESFEESAHRLLKAVWNCYKDFSAKELSDITHEDGTPWSNCYEPTNDRFVDIRNFEIKSHFRSLILECPANRTYCIVASEINNWLEPVASKLAEIGKLEDNWDGYGAFGVSLNTTHFAFSNIFLNLIDHKTLEPDVIPTPEGGVSFQWFQKNQEIEITIDPGDEGFILSGIVKGIEYQDRAIVFAVKGALQNAQW